MDVGQIAKRLLGNPDSAQEVLSLVSRDLGDDAARWISFSRELSASLVVGGESRAIHALGYILAAVIATSESPRGPLEVLVRVAGAVLKSLPFGLGFPSTRHTQSAQRRRQEQMDMYSSLLTIVAKAQAVAPQLFLSLSFSGLSLDFVLSVLLGLAFLTRRAISPGSTQEDTPKAVQLLASCERIETDLLRSLCLNNPRLALCPWALILTQLSNLFHPDPKGDGLPIQSTYDFLSHAFGVIPSGERLADGPILLTTPELISSMREVTMAYSLLPESPGRFVDPWLLARDLLLDYVFTENVEILLTEQIFNTNGSGGRYVVKTCPHSPSSPCTGHYAHFTGLSRHILSEQLSSPEMETLQSITLQLGIALEIRGSHIKASNCPSPTPWVPELEAHMALQIDSDPSTRNMARLNALVLKEFLKLCSVTQKQEKIPGSGQMFTFFWASTIVSHELLIGTLNSLDDDTIHGLAAQDHQVLSSKSQDTASPSSSLLFAMYRRVFFVLDPEVPIRTIPPALFFLKFNRWPYALHTYIDFLCNKSERLDLRETFLDFVEFLLRPGKPKQQRDTGYMLSQLLLVMTNGDISVPELSRFIIIASDVITQENLKRAQIDIYDIVKRDSLRFLHLQSFLMKQKAELESRVYGTQGPSPLDHASLLKQILETSSIGPMSQFPATQDKASLLKTSTSRNPLLIDLIHETPSLILDIRQATTKTLTGLWLEVMLTLPFENFQTYLKEVILFAYPTDKQTNLDFVLFEMTKTGALYTTTLMGLIFDLFRVQKTYEKEKSPASALFKFLGETEASKLVIDGLSYDSSALILTILRDAAVSDQTNSHLISDFLLDALAASKQAALDRFLQDLAVAVTKLTPCPYIPILQHVSLKSTSSPNALKIADTFCQSYLFESDGSNVLSDSGFQEQGVVRELVIRFMSNVTRRQMMNDFVERVLSGTGSLQKSEKLWKIWTTVLEYGHHEWFALHWLPRLLRESTKSLQSFSFIMIQKVFHDIRAFEALFLQPYNGTAMFGIQELVSILSLVDQGMVLEPFLVKLESWMAGPLSKFSDILFKFVDLMAECSWPMHQFILRRVMHFAQSNAQLSVPFVRILHTLCSVEPYDKTRSSPVFLVFLERSAANSPADTRICLESFLKDIYMCNVQTREPSGTAGQVIRQQRGALNKKLQSFIRLCLDAPDNHGSLFAVLMQDSTAFLDLLLCLTAEKNTPVPLIYELIQLISKNGDSDWIFSRHLRVWESHLPGMVERLGHPLPALAKGARDILTSLIVHGQTNKRLSRAILDHVLNWLESQTSAQFSTYLVNSLLSLLDSLLDLPDTNFMLVVHFRAQKWLEENGSGLRIMVGVITLVSVAKKCPCDHSLLEICLTDLDANETSRIECQLSLMEICLEKGFHAGLLLSKTSDLIDLLTSLPLVPRVLAILGRIMTHLASLDARSENHLVEEGEVIRDEFAWVDWALSMSSMLLQRFSWTARGYRSFVLESISQHLAKTWKKLPESHKREIWKGAKSAMQ